MAIGSKDLNSAALRGYDAERLAEELKNAKQELFNLRFAAATGQLDNNSQLKAVRRDIARIYTIMREQELGIIAAPAVEGADKK